MKKILIITAGNVARGGVQKYLMDWIKASQKFKRYDYTWYCCGKILDEGLRQEFERLEVKIHAGNLSMNNPKKYLRFVKNVENILSDSGYDIVHINTGVMSFAFLGLWMSKKKGIQRIIIHSHNSSDRQQKAFENMLCNVLRKYIVKNATICAACSKRAAEWMFGADNLSQISWKYIKNRIDVSMYRFQKSNREKYRRELGLTDECLLGNVGRMNVQKNQMFLMDLMKELQRKNTGIKLIVIGTGPLEKELRLKAEEYQLLDSVIFAGEKKNVDEWLQAMDIFIMPSLHEGLPIAAIEAQAAGLPCLFADNFSREIRLVDQVEFLPLDNIQVWVESIGRMRNSILDIPREDFADDVISAGFDCKSLEEIVWQIYG